MTFRELTLGMQSLVTEARTAIEKHDEKAALAALQKLDLALRACYEAGVRYFGDAVLGNGLRALGRVIGRALEPKDPTQPIRDAKVEPPR